MRVLPLLRTILGAVGAVVLASGCDSLPKTERVEFTQPPSPIVARQAAPRPATGSLYHTASYRPPFEDHRARMVGDVVTILITENVTASQKSSSTANRSSSMDAGLLAFPFTNASSLGKLSINASTNNDGAGATESANRFSGTITTTVVDVLPNGHLVLAGDKQIGVNQNVDVLRFSGTVDPRSIQAGGVVNSTQVANARIESRGRGAQNEAQTVGWIARFFMALLPF